MTVSNSNLRWVPAPAPTSGVVGDANTMRITPDHLGMGQDVIIDSSGTLRSRGGFVSATSDTFTSATPGAVLQTSAGTIYLGRNTSGNTLLFGTAVLTLTGFAQLTAAQVNASTAQCVTVTGSTFTFAKFEDNVGAVIGGDFGATTGSVGCTSMWGGNVATTSDTTTGTAASTIGSTAVAGVGTAWTSALVNCYLFIGTGAAAILVGKVQSVTSTTAIVLTKGAFKTIAAATPNFKTTRPMQYKVYKGRVTTNTASAVVVGSNTKWNSSGPGGSGSVLLTNSVSNMFRFSDGAFIGQVSSVQNDNTITLATTAAIALVNEEYYITNPAFPATGGSTFFFYGNSVARWADHYWYGAFQAADPSVKATSAAVNLITNMPNSLCFSKKGEPECLDLDPTAGDFLTLPSGHNFDRIRGLCSTRGGLVVFRTHDTYLITGYSPDTFRAVKILDDGISLSLSFREYREGVIWAGAKSVWYFDGTKIVDLLQNTVDKFYQRAFPPVGDINTPVTLAVSNDYVIVSFPMNTSAGNNRTWPLRNGTANINSINLVVNLLNGSVTFFTNIITTSSFYSDTLGSSVIVARASTGLSNATGYMLLGNTIFTDSATTANNIDAAIYSTATVDGLALGPNVLWETTKLTLGDATRLKTWKRFLLNYTSDVQMAADIISVNNTTLEFPNTSTGTVSSDLIAINSGTSILHRMRFLARSPSLSVRIYQVNAPSSNVSQKFRAYWWSVGAKLMRAGRVNP